ncbi:hypothetical protein DUNSADRAFT_11767 [Dunaliella salina]|uniref:Encoded protein n=1 Tax=Dunaliella salina TaxID=3046 RepID=A0ABQ7GCL5_DUNSA|nr:hypothetical protein DUNSADRAFT_11767 [Dunaliella salina]|eukprot:KAF5832357.1 hypothetical protein DUNSADRAFT_11767 [Dunaliella salina]
MLTASTRPKSYLPRCSRSSSARSQQQYAQNHFCHAALALPAHARGGSTSEIVSVTVVLLFRYSMMDTDFLLLASWWNWCWAHQ